MNIDMYLIVGRKRRVDLEIPVVYFHAKQVYKSMQNKAGCEGSVHSCTTNCGQQKEYLYRLACVYDSCRLPVVVQCKAGICAGQALPILLYHLPHLLVLLFRVQQLQIIKGSCFAFCLAVLHTTVEQSKCLSCWHAYQLTVYNVCLVSVSCSVLYYDRVEQTSAMVWIHIE